MRTLQVSEVDLSVFVLRSKKPLHSYSQCCTVIFNYFRANFIFIGDAVKLLRNICLQFTRFSVAVLEEDAAVSVPDDGGVYNIHRFVSCRTKLQQVSV